MMTYTCARTRVAKSHPVLGRKSSAPGFIGTRWRGVERAGRRAFRASRRARFRPGRRGAR